MYFLHARDMREFLFGHPDRAGSPPEQSALFSFLRGSEPDREQKNRPIGPSKVATGRPNRPIRRTDACSVPDPAYKVTA